MTWAALAFLLLPAATTRAQTAPELVHAFTIEPAFPGTTGVFPGVGGELMQASDGAIYGTASWIGPSREGGIYILRKQLDGSWKRTVIALEGSVEGRKPS